MNLYKGLSREQGCLNGRGDWLAILNQMVREGSLRRNRAFKLRSWGQEGLVRWKSIKARVWTGLTRIAAEQYRRVVWIEIWNQKDMWEPHNNVERSFWLWKLKRQGWRQGNQDVTVGMSHSSSWDRVIVKMERNGWIWDLFWRQVDQDLLMDWLGMMKETSLIWSQH